MASSLISKPLIEGIADWKIQAAVKVMQCLMPFHDHNYAPPSSIAREGEAPPIILNASCHLLVNYGTQPEVLPAAAYKSKLDTAIMT
jgi:hypothetical protein